MEVGTKAIGVLAQDRFPHLWPAFEATLAEADESHQAGAREAAEGCLETECSF